MKPFTATATHKHLRMAGRRFCPQPELVLSVAKDNFYLERYFLSNIENAISKNVKDVDFVERYRAEIEVSVHSRFVSSSNHCHTLIFSSYTHFGPYYIYVCIESLLVLDLSRYWFCVERYGAEIEVNVHSRF